MGERPTIVTLTVITIPVGRCSSCGDPRLILEDLNLVVTELEEEREEHQRRTEAGPEGTPAVQVNNINFSYGQLQILFDLAFEVKKGESLALLGTNGAGKSTILRDHHRTGHAPDRRGAPPRPDHHLRHARAAVPHGYPTCCPAARACSGP